MEEMTEFGDPDKLISEEDLVILKLDRPCAQPLPDNIIIDSAGQLVSMNQERFICCKKFLSNQHISAALFAGCSAFSSSKDFNKAAELILRNIHTLVVVHNRDLICDLYSKSMHMRTLVLFHNLRLQTEHDPSWKPSRGRQSQLVKLVGTMPALGMNSLLIDFIPMAQAVHHCPGLTWVQSPMDMLLFTLPPEVASMIKESTFVSKRHVILGIRVQALDGTIYTRRDATPNCLARAQQYFPSIYELEVTTNSPESLMMIAHFNDLRRLSITVTFNPCFDHVLKILQKFELEELSLTNFVNVQLSLVARLCGGLSSLSLELCTILEEDAFDAGFPKLTYLRFGYAVKRSFLRALLLNCKNLVTLQMDDPNVGVFVNLAPQLCLDNLERLILNTDRDFVALAADLDDLKRLVGSLPSLRHLATDCYGIRLFFGTHAAHIELAWVRCTTCTAEFPKFNNMQKKVWQEFML